jgi:hypothetical protein
MLRFIALLIILGVFCFFSKSSLAQGTLEATLSGDSPGLSGYVAVYTPDTNVGGPYFSVLYTVTVDTNVPIFTAGRIAGGSTAWAFDLSAPSNAGVSFIYSGTTDMAAFQIDNMLSNLTDFEIYAYVGDGAPSELYGALSTVPEPGSSYLFLFGLAPALLLRKRKVIPLTSNMMESAPPAP